jgi:hypothetical protein
MEAKESVKIIEQMLKESRRTLSKSSFHFILWAILLIPCGIAEWYYFDLPFNWIGWPIAGVFGAIIATWYGVKQRGKEGVSTITDRMHGFIWGAFGICMLFCIPYSASLEVPPHALILLLSGGSTFVTGGLSKFKPLIFGGLFLILMAILVGFIIQMEYQGLIFAIGLGGGYLIPGFMLRKIENEQT